jgi:amidase
MDRELWRLGAGELAEAINTKQVKSREVIESHLGRIEQVNPSVNAITVVLDDALERADEADRTTASGAELPPLHGVPLTIKENIDLAGSATTQGLVSMAEAMPTQDAPQVKQIKAAGVIPLARTNLPDFGFRWHTDNALRGATKNPWNPDRTPGGSSGGEAAALATGMTPLGLGNDYGGSLRWPSQCCGTAAIKPTFGRVPDASDLNPEEFPMTLQLFAVQGPMARRVGDLRIALEAMSGPDPRDPWWTPAPLRGPDLPKPVKVAMTVDPAGRGVDVDVAQGVRRAGRALAEAGYSVEEVEPPEIGGAADLWADLVVSEGQVMAIPFLREFGCEDALRFLDQTERTRQMLDGNGYITEFGRRKAYARAWAQFQQDYPLVLGPVFTMQPFPVGFDLAGADEVAELLRAVRLTVVCNLLGLPAAAVPVGVANGLPQGVQLIGPRYREDLCLDAAEAIEARLATITPIDPANGAP